MRIAGRSMRARKEGRERVTLERERAGDEMNRRVSPPLSLSGLLSFLWNVRLSVNCTWVHTGSLDGARAEDGSGRITG